MESSFPVLIFHTLPEALSLSCLAVVLAGPKLEPKIVLLIGLPFTIAVYLVRLLDLAFGVHTIILIIALAFLLNIVTKIKLSRSLLTALLGMTILAAAEISLLTLALTITGAEIEQIAQDPVLWVLYGWPHIIFMFLLALFINWWRRKRRTKEERANA